MQETLRHDLRRLTRPAHERVDAVFDRFDLGDEAQYSAFLAAHYEALTALPLDPGPFDLPPVRLAEPLAADLAALGRRVAPSSPVSLSSESAALGAYYVVAGSRLGARVLLRRWEESASQSVSTAGRYLSDETMTEGWKAFQQIDRKPGTIDHDAVYEGASAAFALFEAAGRRHVAALVNSAA